MFDPGMIRRLQSDLQTRVEKMNEELSHTDLEASAGGGVVKVVVTADRQLKSLTIGPDAIDPDDPEMLQDLIIAAVNQALDLAKKKHDDEVSKITGGLRFPGLF